MNKIFPIIVLVALTGCKATAEQKAKRIANRAYSDSVYLAQKKNYMIELQGGNFPENQHQNND